MTRRLIAIGLVLLAASALACSGAGDDSSSTSGSSASNAAPDVAPIGKDCKGTSTGNVAYSQGRDFFCIAWRDTYSDEQSYRVELKYMPSGEQFIYPIAANGIEYFVPQSDWPEDVRLTPGACICEVARKDFQITVHAIRASGEVLVGRLDIPRDATH